MTRRIFQAVVLSLVFTWAMAARAADAPAPAPATQANAAAQGGEQLTITVTGVEGMAQVRAGEDQPWRPVVVGMHLAAEGAEFRTGPRSAVRFVIPPDQTITLDRLGTVKVLQAVRDANKVKTDLGMKYGRTRYDIEAAGEEHDSTIHSPGATLAIRGTQVTSYDQPPFAPQLTSIRGHAKGGFRKGQPGDLGSKTGGLAVASANHPTSAGFFLTQSFIDPGDEFARTDNEQHFLENQPSIGFLAIQHNGSRDNLGNFLAGEGLSSSSGNPGRWRWRRWRIQFSGHPLEQFWSQPESSSGVSLNALGPVASRGGAARPARWRPELLRQMDRRRRPGHVRHQPAARGRLRLPPGGIPVTGFTTGPATTSPAARDRARHHHRQRRRADQLAHNPPQGAYTVGTRVFDNRGGVPITVQIEAFLNGTEVGSPFDTTVDATGSFTSTTFTIGTQQNIISNVQSNTLLSTDSNLSPTRISNGWTSGAFGGGGASSSNGSAGVSPSSAGSSGSGGPVTASQGNGWFSRGPSGGSSGSAPSPSSPIVDLLLLRLILLVVAGRGQRLARRHTPPALRKYMRNQAPPGKVVLLMCVRPHPAPRNPAPPSQAVLL